MFTNGKRCVAVALAALAGGGSALADCDGSMFVSGAWRPDGIYDGIYVSGDVYCAQFSFTGGRWGVLIQTSSATGDWADITVGHNSGGVDLWSVTVSQGPSGETKAFVTLATDDFNDVECVQIDGSSLTRLWLNGSITGDLELLDVTDVGYIPASLTPFTVGGDVLDTINLRVVSGVSDLDQVPGMYILGDLRGDVIANGGGIGNLRVEQTIEKTGGLPVNIYARNDIGLIRAGEMYANIEAGHDFGSGSATANIQSVETLISLGTGDFRGTIEGNTIDDAVTTDFVFGASSNGINVEGDLGTSGGSAILTFANTIDGPAIIRVGGRFYAGSEINLPSNGLVGSIIFNGEQDYSGGTLNNAWQSGAEVTVGASTITSNSSGTLPSAVGGGTAGITPTSMFANACDPVDGAIITYWPPAYFGDCEDPVPPGLGGYNGVTLQLRSPVYVDGGGKGLKVEESTNGSSWTDISTDTTQTIDSSSGSRISIVGANGQKFTAPHWYRITPIANKLKALSATGNPDILDFTYNFRYEYSCDLGLLALYDLNGDDDLCSEDVACWMNEPVDLDEDADETDLTYLMNGVTLWQNR